MKVTVVTNSSGDIISVYAGAKNSARKKLVAELMSDGATAKDTASEMADDCEFQTFDLQQ